MRNVLIFILGAAVGATGTWYFAKKKYEKIAQEEINSVKERFTYEKNVDNTESESANVKRTVIKSLDDEHEKKMQSVADYAKKLSQEGYTDYSAKKEVVDTNKDSIPYVITPEEFGEFDDYDRISFTYYADHVLADENDEEVEDIEGSVGIDSLTHFGEYEDDSVYVRNNRLRVDYEILLDQRTYADVIKTKPYLKED